MKLFRGDMLLNARLKSVYIDGSLRDFKQAVSLKVFGGHFTIHPLKLLPIDVQSFETGCFLKLS